MQRSRSRKLAHSGATQPASRRTAILRHAPIAAAIMVAMQTAAADDASSSTGLQEVVVTASKRSENLQDVPVSVQAMDTKTLSDLNIHNFNDYAQQLPTVSFQTLEPGFSRIFMRGIASDNNPNHSGPLPTVGTYLDDQPITTIQGPLDVHVYDIARVEVLPGPQGTLYGASSEAGTIKIVTNKPDTSKFSAGYDVQANDIKNGTGGAIGEGFVNVPLSDAIALRLVGWYERDSGYLNNVPGTLTYPASGYTLNNTNIAEKHYNPSTTYGGRAAMKFDLGDSWTITPTLMGQNTRWGGIFGEENWYDTANGSPINQSLAVKHFYPEGGSDTWMDAALSVQGKIGLFDLNYSGAYLKRTDHTQSDYSDYSLGYDTYHAYWPANSTQLIYGADRYEMHSNELRLTSPKEWPVRFIAGLFEQRQMHNIEQNYYINGLDPTYWVGTDTANNQWTNTWWLTAEQRVNSDQAEFGELNWDITSGLTLTAGVRHYHYKNTIDGFYGFGINAFGTAPPPPLTPGGPPGPGGIEGEQTCFTTSPTNRGGPCEDLNKRADGDGWTPKYNLAYKFDSEHLIYATYSKGFRPGGVNRVGDAGPYQADFLKNYEVGWKTQWFGNTLRFNGSLFYEQWDDFQFSFLGANSVTIVANAGQAKVKGAETQIDWQASSSLTLTLGGAYTDAYLSQPYCGSLNPDGSPNTNCATPQAPEGQKLPNTPEFKGSVSARYTYPLYTWDGFVQANYVYQTAVQPDLRTVERALLGEQGAFGVFNLFIGAEKNNLTLQVLAKNLFDSKGSLYRYSECVETVCAPIAVYNVVTPPRLIGIQLGQKF